MKRSEIIIVTGAGGVGKTTLSAGLAVDLAEKGLRTLVITVDPARRLADALGIAMLEHNTNRPTRVAAIANLDAVMLDVTASWEAITVRHAKPEVADRLIGNPYFRAVADRFPAAQSYAAGEQVAEFTTSGNWDVVVVDTPPAAGGIDFFMAPRKMTELVGGRLLRWLTGSRVPGRRILYRTTARPMLRLADILLGSALLEELADFLLDVRSLYDGLSARAASIDRMMSRATVLVVTTDSPGPMREAGRFFTTLPEIDVAPSALIFNRALPDKWISARGPQGATDLDEALRHNMDRWSSEARRNRDARTAMAARLEVPMATVPWLRKSPVDVEGLAAMVRQADGLDKLVER
ncbi:MAG: ArsA family ATPase [bacterium]|nr:ArsA family ATPase [bacterium]